MAPAGEVPMDCARPIIDTPAKEARCPGDFRVTAPQSRGVSASDTPTTDALPKDARPKDATTFDAAQTVGSRLSPPFSPARFTTTSPDGLIIIIFYCSNNMLSTLCQRGLITKTYININK